MSFCPETRAARRPLNVQDLLGEPIRYDKLSSKEGGQKPKPSGAPSLSLSGGMTAGEAKAFDAFANGVKKGTPTGPRHVDSAKDPSLLEGMGRAANDLRTITKAPIDAAASKVPGAHAAARIPGRVYEGAAKLVPDAVKDARIGGYRLGDATDSLAQTFSPVSLDPNATPADHAEQLALAWSGGKLLGKGAQALGKHGGKVVNGLGASAALGPEAIANATDHAARMFGREVPSMATAGGPKVPAPRAVPHQAHMSGTPNVPPQFQGMAQSSTPTPKDPGMLRKAWNWIRTNPVTSMAMGGAVTAGAAALAAAPGSLVRKGATSYYGKDLPEDIKQKAAAQKTEADRLKALSERGYKDAANGNLRGFAQPGRVRR